jgi:putative nucleotidyltransferase with HDIG domain
MKKWLEYLRDRHNLIYIIFLFVLSFVVLLYLFPKETAFRFEAKLGSVWEHEDVLAPYSFEIHRTEEELEQAKTRLQGQQIPVYAAVEGDVLKQVSSSFESEFKSLILGREAYTESQVDSLLELGVNRLKMLYQQEILQFRPEDQEPEQSIALSKNGVLKSKLKGRVMDLSSALSYLEDGLPSGESKGWFMDSFEKALVPNYRYAEDQSELLVSAEVNQLKRPIREVVKGEVLVRKGQVIGAPELRSLESLKMAVGGDLQSSASSWWLIFGQAILILLSLISISIILSLFQPQSLAQSGKVSFVLLLIILMVLMVKAIAGVEGLHIYLSPLCILPIIVRTFYDTRTALMLHVIAVFMISFIVPDPFEFVFLQIFAGILLQFGMTNLYRRSQFFASAIVIFASYSFTYVGINMVQEGSWEQMHWGIFAWFAGNSALSLLAYPMIYMFEKSFGFISEIRLMEISDTNHSLLRNLNEKAPGTFQHTLQVANLAEEATRAVGGNVLLVRAGALYHDIGKMENPGFFTENQHGMNPHDELPEEESARIIIDHVLIGIEMAKKAKLPEEIIDFIRTHHGTTRTEYFYRNALKKMEEDEVNEEDFRYPGPKPYSKETAILMMADGVEAASRSLGEYTEDRIEALINNIIAHLMKMEQFDNASITLQEISIIKDIFKQKLMNIYHSRVAYPD